MSTTQLVFVTVTGAVALASLVLFVWPERPDKSAAFTVTLVLVSAFIHIVVDHVVTGWVELALGSVVALITIWTILLLAVDGVARVRQFRSRRRKRGRHRTGRRVTP